MIVTGIVLSVVGLRSLCRLLFALTADALHFFAAVTVGFPSATAGRA